jgi:hypothetical protein
MDPRQQHVSSPREQRVQVLIDGEFVCRLDIV